MNLYNIQQGCWDENLLKLAGGDADVQDLKAKLGDVLEDGAHTSATSVPTMFKDTVSVHTAPSLHLLVIIQPQF